MAEFRAFPPLRYNLTRVADLSAVVAPPYDVIDAAERDRLYARDPRNVVRLILNRSDDPYGDAADTLRAWRRDGVLVREARPVLCYHVERFRLPDGTQRERTGVLGVVRLESFDTGTIRPHERTFTRAKEDRLRLIQACRTNLSPIFGMYAGDASAVDAARAAAVQRAPDIALRDDTGVEHRMWLLAEDSVIRAVGEALASETIYIADGHHRYETALAYRDWLRVRGSDDAEAAHNFVLMYLTSTSDPGLVILPTHRIVSAAVGMSAADLLARLRRCFRVESVPRAAPAAFWARLRTGAHGRIGVALPRQDELYVATLEDPGTLAGYVSDLHPAVRRLDVTVLDRAVLRGLMGVDCTAAAQDGLLSYTHDDATALAAVSGGAAAAFCMNAPDIGDVLEVCRAGETMPQKSTYFFPKLVTGLVMHALDE